MYEFIDVMHKATLDIGAQRTVIVESTASFEGAKQTIILLVTGPKASVMSLMHERDRSHQKLNYGTLTWNIAKRKVTKF